MSDLLDERNIDVIEITDQTPVIKVSLPADNAYPIFIYIETTKLGYDANFNDSNSRI